MDRILSFYLPVFFLTMLCYRYLRDFNNIFKIQSNPQSTNNKIVMKGMKMTSVASGTNGMHIFPLYVYI